MHREFLVRISKVIIHLQVIIVDRVCLKNHGCLNMIFNASEFYPYYVETGDYCFKCSSYPKFLTLLSCFNFSGLVSCYYKFTSHDKQCNYQ